MKKSILAMAVVAMSMVSVPAFAQKCNAKAGTCTEQCPNPATCNDQCKPGVCNAPKAVCPFDGLNLTDAQKQQLKDVKNPGKRMAEQAKSDRINHVAQAKADRAAYLKDIKAILTPEQYVQFLENSYVNQRMQPKAPGKPGKNGKKGPKVRKDRPAGPSINATGKKSAED